MMNFSSNYDQNHVFCDSESRIYLNNLSFEEDPIDFFLNEDALFAKPQPNKQIESSCELSNTHDPSASPNHSPVEETHQHLKKKSIFHNFQKHLITLIKKSNNFPQKGCGEGSEKLGYQLWSAFMKTRLFNKKMLHIVFGVLESNKVCEQFSKLAQQFPEFRAIHNRNTIDDIVDAQRLIRQKFVAHAGEQTREEVEAQSNVNRFQEFYEYYQSFVRELAHGPMTKRMTKNRKDRVLQRLEGNNSQP